MTRPDHIDIDAWSREDALRAQEEREAFPHLERVGVPPILRWDIWHRDLPKLQRQYEANNDIVSLLQAIVDCRYAHMPPGRWMATAAVQLLERIEFGEYSTPRELFNLPGKPQPGKRSRARRQRDAVDALLARLEAGETLTAAKYDVGHEYAVGADTLKNLFFRHRRRVPIARHLTPAGWVTTRTGDKAPADRFVTEYWTNPVKDSGRQPAETDHGDTEESDDANA